MSDKQDILNRHLLKAVEILKDVCNSQNESIKGLHKRLKGVESHIKTQGFRKVVRDKEARKFS